MSVKIRLTRLGAKKKPCYRIVVANSDAPRDGKFIEIVGTFNPLFKKDDSRRVKLVKDRIEYWLGVGATPTEKVFKFIEQAGIENPNISQERKNKLKNKRAALLKKATERSQAAKEKKLAEEAAKAAENS